MTKKSIFSLSVLVLLMVGCTEPITVETNDPVESEKMPISIAMDFATRVTDAGYEYGDKVGLYVVNGGNGLSNSGNHVDNMGFTYDGYSTWTPDTPIYWANQYTPATFYCYYPYIEGPTSVFSVYHYTKADQSTLEWYKASEFLWGKAESIYPTSEAVSITTYHMMANMVINLKPGKGFTEESLASADKEVRIHNMLNGMCIDLPSGIGYATNDRPDIAPYNVEGNTYRALVVPQTINAYTDLVTIKIADVTYTFTTDRDISLQSNTRAKFTITIDKINNGVNVGIGEWVDDGEDYGGIAD